MKVYEDKVTDVYQEVEGVKLDFAWSKFWCHVTSFEYNRIWTEMPKNFVLAGLYFMA